MTNYYIDHVDVRTGAILGRYVSDASTIADAVEEAHATLRPVPELEYLVTRAAPCG